jgi:hypothetical protein
MTSNALRFLRSTCSCIAGIVLTAAPASAQNAPTDFCAGGEIAVLGLSTFTEGGSRSGYEKAVSDQLAWYRNHGFRTNRLVTAPVIAQDAATKTWAVSQTEILSLHINPPPIDAVRPDDAYTAFVAEFRKNAVVASERTICLRESLK